MKQTSNSILQSLKKLFTKMTGKKVVKSKTETDLISDIAEAYEPVDTSSFQEKIAAGDGITIASDGKTISNSYSDVVANPTLAGTEADLEGIQVGNTKYKVGGGGITYTHTITLKHHSSGLECVIAVPSLSVTALTKQQILDFLYTGGTSYLATGFYYVNSERYPVHKMGGNATTLYFYTYDSEKTISHTKTSWGDDDYVSDVVAHYIH